MRRELALWVALAAAIAGLVGATVWRGVRQARAAALPIVAAVPDFRLTDRDGRPFGRQELLGEPWVADFVFTRCPAFCPRMSEEMRRLQDDLSGRSTTRLVSFSVDPEHDTPEVLAAYAERLGAGERWHFLTGERSAIHQLGRVGFKLAVEEAAADDPAGPVLHSNRFVLVDADGRIRGYYDSFDAADTGRLRRDLATLGG